MRKIGIKQSYNFFPLIPTIITLSAAEPGPEKRMAPITIQKAYNVQPLERDFRRNHATYQANLDPHPNFNRRPAPVREKKRPKSDSEPALYIFRENRVLKKSVKKRFTASLQPGFCDIKQLYSKKINILRCFTASKRVHLYITDTSLQWISQHSTLGQIRCRHHLKLVHRLRPRISRQPSRWPTSPTQTRAADSRQHRDLDNYTASCCPAIPKANIIASGRTNFAQKCYLCSGKNLKHNERYHSHRFHLRRTEKQVYG